MRIVLVVSIVLNFLLAIAFLALAVTHRRVTTELVADCTAAEVRLQEKILLDLEDPERHEALRAFLERNIEQGGQIEELWRTASERE